MPLTQFGPKLRDTAPSREFGVYTFTGLNVKDVPQQLRETELSTALNGYLTTAGGFRMRNGMTKHGSVPAGQTTAILGLARFYQGVKNGAAVTPPTTILLAQIGNTLYNYDTGGSIGSIGVLGTPLPMTTVRPADPNDANAGFSGGTNDVIVICTGSGGPYIFDGTNLYTPGGWSGASGAQWCALVNGIVWFGGIPSNPRAIFGTGDGVSASFESLPGYNEFIMSTPVTGLAALGTGATAALVIGMNSGVSVLYGSGPGNYSVQDAPMFGDGVAAGRTMVYDGGVCYFLGRQAVYAFDGQSPPFPISRNVEPWILNDSTVTGYPMTSNRNLSWAMIYNRRLYIGYASTLTVPDTVLVYDLVMQGWTVLVTTPGLYCGCLLDAPTDASPAAAVVGSNGTAQVYNWDVIPTSGAVVTDDGSNITCAVQTKYFKVGVPGTIKSLTRLYPEFFISGPLLANVTVASGYGSNTSTLAIPAQSVPTGAQWDVALWDSSYWASGSTFTPFGPPDSRIDVAIQAESYAFGVSSTQGCAPWIFAGLTGVYRQSGRV